MTVFTGPNNSGKSLILKELVNCVTVKPGQAEGHRWVAEVEVKSDGSGSDFISWLAERGVESRYNAHLNRSFLPDRHANSEEYGIAVDSAASSWERGELGPISHFLIKDQWTDERLGNQSDSSQWDWRRPASHPSQVLWESADRFREFSTLFERAFGIPIAINRYIPQIRLQLGPVGMEDTAPPPPAELREAYAALPFLNEQGDGMRAFANLLLHTLVRPAPIIVIDEPEAFLHPPQARLLALYLTRYAPAQCQVFVSTHSADFLGGALEGTSALPQREARGLALVRISRTGARAVAHTLPPASVTEILNTPLLRYSNIISGLFHDGVVLCEAEGDCQFYSATLDVIRGEERHDNLVFLHVNGKARLSDATQKLRACGIPTAAIADLDFLNDTKKVKDAIIQLGGEWNDVKDDVLVIQSEASSVLVAKAAGEIKKRIVSIIGSPRGNTLLTQQQIAAISETLKTANGWKTMKSSGVEALDGDSYAAVLRVVSRFATLGFFLVPVGELESWVRDVPRSNKNLWLSRVFEDGRHLAPSEELRRFVKGVRDYLVTPI
ncbi:AAA family ATPase [Streptomyces lavenduligriseus]|uniref:AAA family ATPase n=1 Tax=Streptomyces lavenduligriseus TaxID=67315 RepID=A0ABT0NRE5_9ACTN|nr:ATP-binding protein [Streptomyces lavenduligriseus]MCL3994039.1 AAA family ATPase [Streptomyces lavenduligriseus]